MNGWDVFTWVAAVILGVSAIVVFVFFLRDAGSVIRGEPAELPSDDDRDEPPRA